MNVQMTETHLVTKRHFLVGSLALAGAALAGGIAKATPSDLQLIDIAKREISRAGSKVWIKDMVGIADFSRPSSEARFFIVDLLSGKVRPFLVAHGIGSDPEHDGFLKSFSNEPNSRATSRGSFVTQSWYEGIHGSSMRLSGLDPDNCNAEERAIVVHGAWYANPEMITQWGKLGRSEGCFAFGEGNLMEILARLGPGRLIFSDKLEVS
jgi:L,D-transpeptidase catalytic domain